MDLHKCEGDEENCLNHCKSRGIEVSRKVDLETMEIDITHADRCVWKYITPVTREYYRLYRLYKDGFLLESGAVNDQPPWYISVMLYIDSEFKHCESDARKRALDK